MSPNHKYLVAMDDTETSMRAISYLANSIGGHPDTEVWLFHALSPMPAKLLEHEGGDTPEEEVALENVTQERQQQVINKAKRRFHRHFDQATRLLTESGFAPDSIHHQTVTAAHSSEVPHQIVDAAKEHDCSLIVVGRDSYPWYKDFFKSHVADSLVKQTKDVAVCVVT